MSNSPTEKERDVRLIDACPLCGRPKRTGDSISGTISSWLAPDKFCRCSRSKQEEKLKTLYQRNKETIYNERKKGSKAIPRPKLGEEYEILEELGHGGMASVYRVRRQSDDREFALKVMHPDVAADIQQVKRFKLEAKAVEKLEHPNLIPVYGQGKTEDDLPFILMGLSPGTTLLESIKGGESVPLGLALKVVEEIGKALLHAHQQGIVHRDIKPSNVMIEKEEGGVDRVKVVDFGIAKVAPIENRVGEGLTMTGEFFGTPAYMSPEHCLGKSVDERSDIYSLGCLFYEMLAGHPPFWSENPIKVIVSHVNDQPPPFESGLKIDENVEKVILKALRKEPEDRYQGMSEFLDDIKLLKAGKKVKIKELKQGDSGPSVVDTTVILSVMILMVALVAVPALLFLPNTFDYSRESQDSRSILVVGQSYKRQAKAVPGRKKAGAGTIYDIKNEFGEVVFSGSGADQRAASRAAISGALAAGKSLRGVELKDLDLSGMKLAGADLSNCRMFNVDCSGSDLTGANLSMVRITKCNFQRVVAPNAKLGHSELQKVRLQHSDLMGAKFHESKLKDVFLDGARLGSADLSNTRISSSNGKGVSFGGAKLNHTQIYISDFQNCNFDGADFRRGIISKSDCTGSTFKSSLMGDTHFNHSKFNKCAFDGAAFKNEREKTEGYYYGSPFYNSETLFASFVDCDVPEEKLTPGR